MTLNIVLKGLERKSWLANVVRSVRWQVQRGAVRRVQYSSVQYSRAVETLAAGTCTALCTCMHVVAKSKAVDMFIRVSCRCYAGGAGVDKDIRQDVCSSGQRSSPTLSQHMLLILQQASLRRRSGDYTGSSTQQPLQQHISGSIGGHAGLGLHRCVGGGSRARVSAACSCISFTSAPRKLGT